MQVIADLWIGKQGDMPESIMEHIWFFEVIQLFHFSDPGTGSKPFEDHQFKKLPGREQSRHGIYFPAG